MSVRTIKQKSYTDIQNEYEAGGAILPGSVVSLNASGQVVVNATAGGPAPTLVAIENELEGKTTRDSYASGDRVQTWYVQPGEEFLGVIDSTLDPDVGDLLEVGTDGELQAASAGVAQFQVLEAKQVDSDSNHRVLVRVI